ncbi:type 2 lantibiotic, SP_1948 family [Butyrivibrio fibrisolvens DSM 3071]|uniref:Type 2 lantibiotic, SP_1948 family n=1 Tax=Butyrivibrio fibrisolvens DSM 3071 TaxID=1121131 RepID=A0A1M5Q3W8_BUTFI|nr:lichenicidin A2 family type 2 lantibiotic [Butyrivibrio fibrisolvens]SHH08738.1 type 2 lantibiotic, SP_1948 family [Butyrivibrio fibrisolvens DSM 3071]
MSSVDMKNIVGDSFEDMSIAEMAMVQGSGDLEGESVIATLLAVSAAVGSAAGAIQVVKTIKGTC